MAGKTKNDYEEWKGYILRIYSEHNRIVDAVWNEIMEIAERDGVADYLIEDEEDMIECLGTIVNDAKL